MRPEHNTHTKRAALAVLMALAVAVVAGASGTVEEPPITTPVRDVDHTADMRFTELIGASVYHKGVPRVATVADAIVDLGQGVIAHVVIRFADDSLRTSDALFPVPLYLLSERSDGNGLDLLLEDETLIDDMPTLEQATARAAAGESEWERWLFSFWNTVPGYPGTQIARRRNVLQEYQYRFAAGPTVVPSAMVRATELVNADVLNPETRRIGRVDDAVVNLNTGQLLLVNMRPASSVNASESNYLIPVAALVGNRETATITYDIDEYGIGGPSAFSGSWPDITSNEYHARLARFWNTRDVGTRYGAGMTIVPTRLITLASLGAYDLYTRDTTSPGQLVDALINADGSIEYVVIEFGDFAGLGGRRSVAPIALLSIQPITQAAVLNVLTGDMSDLPSFDANRIADTSEDGWDESVRRYWNNYYRIETSDESVGSIPTTSSVGSIPSGRPLPASALTSFSVVSTAGEDLGMITDLRLDMVESSVGFAVVELPGMIFGGAEFPLPISAMTWQPDERTVTVDATLDRIEQAPGYDSVPDFPAYEFIDDLESYWSSSE